MKTRRKIATNLAPLFLVLLLGLILGGCAGSITSLLKLCAYTRPSFPRKRESRIDNLE